MEDQCSPLIWPSCYYPEEGIEELKHSLLYTTLELETTVISAHEELARKDEELAQLKGLLSRVIKERDEAQAKCQKLALERILLQQQMQIIQKQHLTEGPAPSSRTSSYEDEPATIGGESSIGLSSSDCDENNPVVASPGKNALPQTTLKSDDDFSGRIAPKKPLPEKGKFLQAVMEAGPLLQTLLLAGPLPQWQHPPPQLSSIEIPPVTINSSPNPTPRLLHQDSSLSTSGNCFTSKRVFVNNSELGPDSSPNTKYQKVVHQSPLTNA